MTDIQGEALVWMQSVVKRRTQGDSVFELNVPEFCAWRGQLTAVVGESGCGKSTLLDLIALVMKPTQANSFHLQVDEQQYNIADCWDRNDEPSLAAFRRHHLGYVLQTGGLLPFLSVADNIMLPARVKGMAVDGQRLNQLAQRLGIASCLTRKPDALSIGQRQRVAILRALIHAPALILADEPTAAVDKTRAMSIMQELSMLAREEGQAVIIVTHDVGLVETLADQTYGFETTLLDEHVTQSVCRRVG